MNDNFFFYNRFDTVNQKRCYVSRQKRKELKGSQIFARFFVSLVLTSIANGVYDSHDPKLSKFRKRPT